MSILITIAAIAFIIWLLMKSIGYGAVAAVIFLAYLYFKKYTNICMYIAFRNYAKDEMEKAFRWFERGFKHGMNIQQKVAYSYYLLREGRTEKAEQILGNILAFKLKPQEKYLAKSHHALVLMKTGREQEALEELLEIFPAYKNTTIYGSIGYLYFLIKPIDEAEEFNLEAYEFNSDDAIIIDNLVQVYLKKQDYEKAFSLAQKVMEKNPSFIEAYYNAALAAKALQKPELAREYLEKTKELKTTFLSSVSHEDVEKLMEELPARDNEQKSI